MERDWHLFLDWCTARDINPDGVDVEHLIAFGVDLPAARSTVRRRMRSVVRMLSDRRQLVLPTATTQQTAIREGAGWLPVDQALASLPVTSWPEALPARRDGYLIVLLHTVGLSRTAARRSTADEIDVYGWPTVAGKLVPFANASPATCPACHLTRWLATLAAITAGGRAAARYAIDHDRTGDEHVCGTEIADEWRAAETLLPGIDRHGWLSDQPLSKRAITATMAARQTPLPVQSHVLSVTDSTRSAWFGRRPPPDRDLDDLLDRLDAAIDELTTKTGAILTRSEPFD
jgi:hypothetical protein